MLLNFWRDYHDWIFGLGTLVVALCAAMALHRAGAYLAARIARRTPSSVDDSIVRRAHNPARALILLFAFLVFVPSVPFPDRVSETLRRMGVLLLTASLGWLMANLTGVVKDWIAARFDIHNPDNLRARQVWTQTLLLHRFALGVILTLTVCIMLMNIPGIRQVGVSLFASAGVAGIVLGMAAQQVLKNVIAGIQLAMTDPVRVDDVVIVEGEWGTIEEIRSTYIVVKIWDLRRLVVPLSYFLEKPFQNWTRRTANLLGTVFLYVDYTVPVDRVREQLQQIVGPNKLWDGNVCGLQVTDMKDRTLELRVIVSAANAGQAFDLRCEVREALVNWLQREFPETLPKVRAELSQDRHDDFPLSADARAEPRPS